ncbi:MAG: hypothetical protein JJU06_02155 [Ectothiorhodospiraceae bacterium]|nr:hypothetical protein [Ectothiorhodospiraceae bacterium]MCH8505084.1 hypothetical protein [Ectothiorhodospiraceae bacterium]
MKSTFRYAGTGLIALLFSGVLLLSACEPVDEDDFEQMEQDFEEQQ